MSYSHHREEHTVFIDLSRTTVPSFIQFGVDLDGVLTTNTNTPLSLFLRTFLHFQEFSSQSATKLPNGYRGTCVDGPSNLVWTPPLRNNAHTGFCAWCGAGKSRNKKSAGFSKPGYIAKACGNSCRSRKSTLMWITDKWFWQNLAEEKGEQATAAHCKPIERRNSVLFSAFLCCSHSQ